MTRSRTAGEKARDLAVQLIMRVGHAGQILLFKDRGAKARLGENHNAGGGLQKMRAGPAANHQKEGVRHFPVKPDDACQTAENLMLAPFFQDRSIGARSALERRNGPVHDAAPSRAWRSLRRNCVAFTA